MTLDSVKKINGNFKHKDILSLDQFTPKDLDILFKQTKKMKTIAVKAKASQLLAGNIITLLFYEPSSRTFGSFGAAVKQLGGQTIEIQDPQHFSSVSKGETFEDTIRTFEAYTDAIILRHPHVGATKVAADAAEIPLLSAGDGIGEHPTQALLDLYTIYETHGSLDGLTGVLAGDLLNGRTVHSLIRGLSLYKKNTLYLLSPKELSLSRPDYKAFSDKGIKLIEIFSEKDMPEKADFWYWTRVQKERFKDQSSYEKIKNKFIVTEKLVKEKAGKKTIIMHPLPRVGEIETAVDADPRAVYLRSEIRNGMYIRMALLVLVLGKV
ncbi:MAG: aspartate carbamoyltransferase [Candidatus Levyibacteriota bacterium]